MIRHTRWPSPPSAGISNIKTSLQWDMDHVSERQRERERMGSELAVNYCAILHVHLFLDDFTSQTGGLMCFYSLKNPSFPE